MHLIKVLLFFVLGIMSLKTYSQEKNDKNLLINLLPKLENQYNVTFNYLDSNVQKEVFLTHGLSIKEALNSLEKQTLLRFEVIDKNQILIRPLKKTDLVNVCGYIEYNSFFKENIEVQPVLTIKPVLTNKKGYFELKDIPYSSNIILRDNNFFLKTIPVKLLFKETCPVISISIFQEILDEVLVVNYLTKGVIKENQKTSISTNDFSILPGITEPDIMKSLEHIPSVQSPFEMVSKIYVRGSTPDQNLILWNGIRTYNQSHFFGLISAFNPYTISKTDFYAKAVQAEYGDRLGGVVNMYSGKEVYNKFSAEAGLNFINGDVFAKIPILENKLSLEVSGRRSYTDFLETPAYKPMAERVFQNEKVNDSVKKLDSDFYFFDYNIGIQYKLSDKDEIQFNTLHNQNNLEFYSNTENANFSDKLITKTEGYSLQWQHLYSSKLSQATELTLSNYTLDYLFNTEDLNENNNREETKKNFVNDYGAKTYFELDFSKNTQLQIGYQYSSNNIRYAIKNNTDNFSITLDEQENKLKTHSLFSEYQIDLKPDIFIQFGLRANKYSTSKRFFLEPRLYLEALVLPNFKLNSSATLTSQAVTQIQESIISSLTLENLLWRITDNEEFNVLTSQQYSLGSNYKNKGWFIETDVFYKFTQNVTTLTAGFLNPFGNEFNTGVSKTIGTELFLKKKFKKYSSWISYTFTNQESQFEAINQGNYFISNLNVEHTFKWQHYYQLNKFQFSLGWLWHSGRATTNISANKEEGKPVEIVYDELNEQNLPVYHKLDLSVLYNFNFSPKIRYQLGASVQNIYNRKSILNREYKTTAGLDNELLIVNYNTLGFTPNVSLRVFWQ